MEVQDIARITHEANRALCAANGDLSQPSWVSAPQWQIDNAVNGVRHRLANPGAAPADSHANWMREKQADGWVYGPEKDPEAKTHPCMVPFDELPAHQQAKDHLFCAVVDALKQYVTADL